MAFLRAVYICHRHLSTDKRRLTPKTRALLDRILRVDHAGELGAVRIYEGQLAVLGRTKTAPLIEVPAEYFSV